MIEQAKRIIVEESRSINNLSNYLDDNFANVVKEILATKGRLVITGIGKSALIANKIVATMNSTGTPALFMHAAEAIHGDLGMIQKDDIVLCISKSGNTPEIKVLIPLLKRGGNKLIAMVSERTSYLAEHADYVLYAHVEREADINNLAPTNSTTAQLVMGDTLAMCLLEQRKFTPQDFAKYHPGGALGKRMYMRVDDIFIEENAPKVFANQTITEVIIEISSKRLGATAVVDENNNLLGIITDGDLRRMLEKNTHIADVVAADIMSKNPKTISRNELAIKAFEQMEKNSITQLVVTDGGKYLGMIHLHDLLKEGIV
ncbi:MAG: KpsF/GutQ family sugar-phosphate isomerase [Bacteroidales bacterium]|nr:KpsF/GutQ family sugar-phosphate isomerase [Bacteroidales bacterium]MBR4349309.1 KpsF/GutQ family sugar-phosphate isomerase [Bacteroidales bacterium]MBR6265422.1 KpsF/GutQ family sugar-phosphate isomerase [Bacteroidales bacterium]MCR4799775.1 KpsF/GutQ family sugar-phosphate isomerase [Bacteroidales bacterium]